AAAISRASSLLQELSATLTIFNGIPMFRICRLGFREKHRPPAIRGESIAVHIDHINIAGALGDAFGKYLFTLGRHRAEYAFENFRVADLAPRDAMLGS